MQSVNRIIVTEKETGRGIVSGGRAQDGNVREVRTDQRKILAGEAPPAEDFSAGSCR